MDKDLHEGCMVFITGIAIIIILSVVMAFPTMWLWNWLMPELFAIKTINILQAIGINVLSGVLFKNNNYSVSKKG